ncbi:MAG: PQQ-dependent sugar dehydrogenase [Cytophagaceae bacterium]|nr:PQQ-dependent sugar dehydrogenase [Gemmatimonadaceae bacterium]
MRKALTLLFLAAPAALTGQGTPAQCAPDNAGLKLPAGFCAQIVADSIGTLRHATFAPNGDLYIAVRSTNTQRGGILALRDADGDGVLEKVSRIGTLAGSEIVFHDGYLYFGTDTAIVRYKWSADMERPMAPDTVVMGMRAERGHHAAKTFAIGRDGSIYVNIGAPSNACEEKMNVPGTKGLDPCPLLETSGGIWKFDGKKLRQSQADGERWTTGIRNIVAITMDPSGRVPYGTQHGRDLLAGNWGKIHPIYTEAKSAENPAEEMFRLDKGADFGWPYCYYDVDQKTKVLAPEYGGDGVKQGKCASIGQPVAAYPGHWAPNAMLFYTASAFPAKYRNGAFIAFHGSWNRAPGPQAGFNVVFQPFANGRPSGAYEVFADGFRGGPTEQQRRPTGLVVAPDGSLIVTDDKGGRVYRVRWVGR